MLIRRDMGGQGGTTVYMPRLSVSPVEASWPQRRSLHVV